MKPSFLQVLGTYPDVASPSSLNRTPRVKGCPLSVSLPSPCPHGIHLLLQTSKNWRANLQGADLSQAVSALLGLLILMGMAAWWHPWVLSCSATDRAGGGRHKGTMWLSLQRPCKTNSLLHARGLDLLVTGKKKSLYSITEINTDINTNNPMTFVLTAW